LIKGRLLVERSELVMGTKGVKMLDLIIAEVLKNDTAPGWGVVIVRVRVNNGTGDSEDGGIR
jgi:hypothetical protein